MITASLVTYKHRLKDIQRVTQSVLNSQINHFYFIDNASDNALRTEAHAYSPKIYYIPSENRGFGAGHNIAIRDATADGAVYHAIINPDIEFEPGTIEKIIEYMDENPDIGLVMPKTVYPDGSMQYNCKLVPTPFDLIFKRFLPKSWTAKRMERFQLKSTSYEEIMDVPYLCGCFMVFRIETLREVGLFDERFFMYPEDIDITRRIYASRFRSVYYPRATVIHAHAAASRTNWKMLRIHIFNMIKYFNKWGWFFDPERKRINREVLAKLK